jgi:methionine-rich copper-binding protein CopC
VAREKLTGDRRWLRLVAVGLVALATLVAVRLTTGGFEPAELVSAQPADGERLPVPPAAVSLTFSGEVDPAEIHVAVAGADGTLVSVGDPTVAGGTVTQPVRISGGGPVVVAYHVALVDGREVAGQRAFRVGAGGGPPPPAPTGAVAQPAAPTGLHDHAGVGLLGFGVVIAILLAGGGVLVLAFRRPRPR